jgi:hypothetical protein
MKRLLKYPAFNAICLSVFTAFYASLFFTVGSSVSFKSKLIYSNPVKAASPFWFDFSRFLSSGHSIYFVGALLLLTAAVVVLLVSRPKPYDEYHISILTQCLVVAIILTLVAIAILYIALLLAPEAMIEKFTLFIIIHWTTIVVSDMAYVLICRWK